MDQDEISLRRHIGYVIQDTGLFPHWSIEKNIATVPMELKWEKEKIEQRVKELMEIVELDPSYAKKKPSALSGGQKQRVGVARALASDPPIMLMDEPFGALDPITRNNLQNEFLKNIQEKLKKTIVFVTHDMDEAVKMGDKIAVMQYGKLVQFGTPSEILRHPANEFVENLVGQNRMIKRFSLIRCTDSVESEPFFRYSEKEAILAAVKTNQYVGILKEDGQPAGYIDTLARRPETTAELDQCMIKSEKCASESDTLYDVMSLMFALGQKAIFTVDSNHKGIGLVSMKSLFDKGNDGEAYE